MQQHLLLPRKISPLLAEETGWHIGDGSMNYYKKRGKLRGSYSLRGHIRDDKSHYIQRIKPLFKSIYNLDVPLHEMPSTGVFGFQIWNSNLVEFKQKLGLPLGKKREIYIPKIFTQRIDNKIAILRGIFDTDGCIYLENKNNRLYPRMHIGTISRRLSADLLSNFKELDFRVTRHYELPNKKQRRIRKLYVLSIRGEIMFLQFMKIINPQNPKHIQK